MTIGECAFVAAGAVINRDGEPCTLTAGVPARQIGYISAHAERLELPVCGEGEALCPVTGTAHRLVGSNLS